MQYSFLGRVNQCSVGFVKHALCSLCNLGITLARSPTQQEDHIRLRMQRKCSRLSTSDSDCEWLSLLIGACMLLPDYHKLIGWQRHRCYSMLLSNHKSHVIRNSPMWSEATNQSRSVRVCLFDNFLENWGLLRLGRGYGNAQALQLHRR